MIFLISLKKNYENYMLKDMRGNQDKMSTFNGWHEAKKKKDVEQKVNNEKLRLKSVRNNNVKKEKYQKQKTVGCQN